ncbi:alpha/beta fold hydrolase [Novosphingobium sp. JCM 18896]|uniref:alpha/beta fold hydrolase n=1 Tax=Novosphingobium sp. JCM 18896 TaxID=2989731 RepID=UPI00222359AD|nr:alpha/beta hydrolase [Novosphingobium sp. JCM 18896]MCW1427770.1 alpha/beta hydrolase [Novosphingobium sp. JCM 18896]
MSLDAVCEAPAIDRRAIAREARESLWYTRDDYAIRRIDWGQSADCPRGSLLFMPGRGDAYEKYLETLGHWHTRGWRVTSTDWRGQAGSGRLGTDAVTGHVDDFALWIDDLADFWADWTRETPGPHVLVGHSMGGHLVLRALVERRVDPAALVLIAPMLGLHPHWLPPGVLHTAARLMRSLGDPRRPAWKWSEKPGEPPASRIELLTHDAERYADEIWWRQQRPELMMGPGSWGWIAAALASIRKLNRRGALEAVATPVLALATTADKLVEYTAIERAVQRPPKAELVRFGDEARHEILRESDGVRDRALDAIDGFLARTAPAS